MKACVFTLGCKMNEVESESLARGLLERGFTVTGELCVADLYLLNTCAVTAEAEKKSRQAVARMRKFNPLAPVLVCGCASHFHPEQFAQKEGVYFITGAQKKQEILTFLDENPSIFTQKWVKNEVKTYDFSQEEGAFCELPFPKREKTRAFLRIQDGCNNFCSYCIIPYLRGRTRSRSVENILKEATSCGAKEIVLTGIDISSYAYQGRDLGALLLELSNINARIRLGSIEASLITRAFLTQMKEAKNIVPHFHLSLQSGSNAVLKKMNRHYTREEYLEKCALIYEFFPAAAITTDIIVGFPTEREEDFLQSLSIVKEAKFAHVHAFPFSPRAGTVAAKLPDISPEIKKERVARLLAVAGEAEEEYRARFLGKEEIALFEEDGGYTRNYLRVYAQGIKEGTLARVICKQPHKDGFLVEILEVLS